MKQEFTNKHAANVYAKKHGGKVKETRRFNHRAGRSELVYQVEGSDLKSFQKALDEGVLDNVLNMGSKYLYFWKNKWIINTKHGLERIIQRSKLSIEQLKKLFKTAIEKFTTMNTKVGDEFLFYSRSLQQGFISAVGPQGNLRLITFLPPGKSIPKEGTKKMVIEGVEYDNITIVEID